MGAERAGAGVLAEARSIGARDALVGYLGVDEDLVAPPKRLAGAGCSEEGRKQMSGSVTPKEVLLESCVRRLAR